MMRLNMRALVSACVGVCVSALCMISLQGCSLPDTPQTQAKIAALNKTKADADKTAADATAQATALQSQIDGLRAQLTAAQAAGQAGTAAFQALQSQNQALAAQLDAAVALHDQNAAISAGAKKALDDLNAQTAKNASAWATAESMATTGGTVMTTMAPATGPGAGVIGVAGGLLLLAGGVIGKVHSLLVSTPAAVGTAVGQVTSDARAALDAQADIASHATTAGATPVSVSTHAAAVLSGLTATAKALYNATPDIVVNTSAGAVSV